MYSTTATGSSSIDGQPTKVAVPRAGPQVQTWRFVSMSLILIIHDNKNY